ncbi:MAG: alpha-glucan family phosphorylase [Candidatus Brocadiaceae bacterium]|uniref:alpha-glucan family phosphorylase n=1 Tax=Candidatus Wunengus sp. YC61 TaxID=3367698 RepID=UPI0027207AF6|nr:alpha-glucan family phosphorylase [Candidatus Brocadiaceae bacterium]
MNNEVKIAYFSMEIGISNNIPTYSGGLGVLAGDTIKSGADLKIPMVAVTLLSKKGYFRQDIDSDGRQIEYPIVWDPSKFLIRLSRKIAVQIEGRDVYIQAWRYNVQSVTGGKVDVIYLDTDVEENTKEDREITAFLYGGDDRYRLKQEIVLGIGGVRMLHALGFHIKKYHMNEGHASLLTLELLLMYKRDIESVWDERWIWDIDAVRELCVFTTHTPIDAGHDRFSYDLVKKVMGEVIPLEQLKKLGGENHLNMTRLGLNLSNYVNGVAKKHGEVSKALFPGYEINAITNGVHSFTWTCEGMKQLYDKYIPGWANEPELFVRSEIIPDGELWEAHLQAKKDLIQYVNKSAGIDIKVDVLTFGFARRFTSYKRADLIFSDLDRLLTLCEKGEFQILYAGKAHPKDTPGKDIIKRIIDLSKKVNDKIKIVFLKDYNIEMALKLVSGVDVWLNTPLRPREASGTSGMKAAHNGVINFSVLDGWWIEGHIEGITGWSIGPKPTESSLTNINDAADADDLYYKLENIIIPMYYHDRNQWIKIMKNSIGKIAYYFNSHRMMRRYVTEAYLR